MPVMSYVRCLKCAYENNPQYRFCGMCGSSLPRGPIAEYALSGAPGEDRGTSDSSLLPPLTEPFAKHSPGRSNREEPSEPVSGPSFLGLSDDPQRNLSYLLEDDEPRQGRARSLIALLVILLLAAVVWVVHSKRAEDRERASQVAPPSSVSAPPDLPGTINPATPPAAGESPASGAPAAEAPKSTEAAPAPAAAPNPEAANSAPSGGSQPPPPASEAPSTSSPSPSSPSPSPSSAGSSASSASVPPPSSPEPASPPPAAKPSARGLNAKAARAQAKAATKRAAKASAKPPAAAEANQEGADHESEDPLFVQGQKYLYGQGVPQSCALAEKNLRLSAQNSNPEAQSMLGTMYATGHCVARDLPAAYRWFARASHLEPNNQRIEQDLEVLWRQMTPEEKVVATRSH